VYSQLRVPALEVRFTLFVHGNRGRDRAVRSAERGVADDVALASREWVMKRCRGRLGNIKCSSLALALLPPAAGLAQRYGHRETADRGCKAPVRLLALGAYMVSAMASTRPTSMASRSAAWSRSVWSA
jgi:hypothetical protein